MRRGAPSVHHPCIPPLVQSFERLDMLRRRVLLVGAALCVPVSIALFFSSEGKMLKAMWVLGFGAVIAWLAISRNTPSRWQRIVPTIVCVGMAPWVCAAEPGGKAEWATLCLLPIVISIVFMDVFDVVLAATASGWVANTLYFWWLGWSVEEVITVMVLSALGALAMTLSAMGTRSLESLEREAETQHGQALRVSESRRAQAERLAIVGRLASGVAHEINNPLAFVKANVNALRGPLLFGEDPFEPAELKEILDDTTQGIDRICQIVADLKGFAREDSGIVEPVSLHDSVAGALRLAMVRLPREVDVVIDVPESLPSVRASQRKLSQVLLNLLVNAGDALEERRTLKPRVVIAAVRNAETITLNLTDNGPGIPPAVMVRLFEPFFTTKPPGKGTGLGLALSREYVEAFGGTLSVQNAPEGGAQFSITMRIVDVTGEMALPTISSPSAPEREPLLSRRRRTGS